MGDINFPYRIDMIVFLERYKTNFTLYSDKDIIFTESGIYCLFIPLFLLYRPCLTFSFCYEGRIGDGILSVNRVLRTHVVSEDTLLVRNELPRVCHFFKSIPE